MIRQYCELTGASNYIPMKVDYMMYLCLSMNSCFFAGLKLLNDCYLLFRLHKFNYAIGPTVIAMIDHIFFDLG